MAKIDGVQEVRLDSLKPYEKNAKVHGQEQVNKIADSIREFGFLSPILIDRAGNIIAGHGRVLAARQLGMEQAPAVYIEGLTETQRRAYILADNKLTELGGWDDETVLLELEELRDLDFDISLTGFDLNAEADWFGRENRNDTSREEGNEEYNEWLDKFEPKKTTDDCYTPDLVYEAVAGFVAKEYDVKRADFVRPFYPGGDYQAEKYAKGAIVVDNPPFSILAEILRFYAANGIRFFLFAPSLTLFSCAELDLCYIAGDADITYENGATVNTSFVTNLDCRYMVRTAPELTEAVKEANRKNREEIAKPVNLKYKYPPGVITAAMVGTWAAVGVDFKVPKKSGAYISALDAQKQFDKTIYGGGFLLSEKAKADAEKAKADAEKAKADAEKAKADAEKAKALEAAKALGAAKGSVEIDEKTGEIIWQLSDREREIVRALA